jgi:hypothetical protein
MAWCLIKDEQEDKTENETGEAEQVGLGVTP